jgi:hypothetical protein
VYTISLSLPRCHGDVFEHEWSAKWKWKKQAQENECQNLFHSNEKQDMEEEEFYVMQSHQITSLLRRMNHH